MSNPIENLIAQLDQLDGRAVSVTQRSTSAPKPDPDDVVAAIAKWCMNNGVLPTEIRNAAA